MTGDKTNYAILSPITVRVPEPTKEDLDDLLLIKSSSIDSFMNLEINRIVNEPANRALIDNYRQNKKS